MGRALTLSIILSCLYAKAQIFTGTGGTIQNNGQETYFNLPVSGLSQGIGIEDVCFTITHPTIEELYIYLESPGGIRVELTNGMSCSGVNYTNTCLNNNASTSVTIENTPYTGSFRPIGFLGRFNNGQSSNGTWKLIIKDYLAFINQGDLVTWSIKFGSSTPAPVNFSSSNLPIVVINTNNQPVVDTKSIVNMGIIYNGSGQRNNMTDAWNNFNGSTSIHLRGNSTRFLEKKPYSIELLNTNGTEQKASLLGMPPESDWILSAPYQDKSLVRVQLTYHLFRQMGHYASRAKNVELVLNNEYQGIYILLEKLKRDQNRINISKLSNTENFYPQITGGYILKIDRPEEAGWYSLLGGSAQNNARFYYQYVYPKDTAITVPQKAYIKNYLDSFETTMSSAYFDNPIYGYKKYIDVGSFVDFFIINELSKNVDAYRLSTYMYKDNISYGGKLHIGPVWDYDLAWHNCNYGNAFDPAGWQYQVQDTAHPSPTWWSRFLLDTNFVNNVYCRWNQLRLGVLSNTFINAYIDSTVNVLNEAQQRNFIQWPVLGAYIFPNPQNQLTAAYTDEVADLKNWIASRTQWLDWAITGRCAAVGIKESDLDKSIIVFPNPFVSTTTFSIRLQEEANVSLQVMDVMGKEISLLINETKPAGEFNLIYDRKETAAGIYFYRLIINNKVKIGKISIQ